MTRAPAILHGGDLEAARRRFPSARTPWIDLSTGINPRVYPVGPLGEDAWHRLPGAREQRALEAAAADAYGAPRTSRVVAAPGTQAVIQRLPQLWPARRVAVLGFGYQEHPAVWRAAGAVVTVVPTIDDLVHADVAVVVNPNNPDGRASDPIALAALAARLAGKGGLLVVDEAFADGGEPGLSLVPHLPPEGAVVLRSFGKFFGLAGLRLGFAIGSPAVTDGIREALGPWAVSGPALAIGAVALGDRGWHDAEAARLAIDVARLDSLLHDAGLRPCGGTHLFRLVEHARAAAWFERLGEAGILVRAFPARPEWLRFGLPGSDDAWRRLAEALGSEGR